MQKIILFILLITNTLSVFAQKENDSISIIKKQKIIIGIKNSPPFIMHKNGEITGLSVDLWQNIANELNINYEFKIYNLTNLLDAIKNKKVDLCISPLTVTSERLMNFDFTQPFFTSNVAIAVPGSKKSKWIVFITNFFSLEFLEAVFFLFIIILLFGTIVWIAEKRKNPQFGKGIKGLANGIWWSAVTMTTVGYGDKSPKSGLGRFLAILWMYIAIMIISSLTASITTALTVNEIGMSVNNIEDLRNMKIGTVKGSSTEEFLLKNNIIHIEKYENTSDGLNDLANQKIQAFVYDEPIIRYLIRKNGIIDKVQIVPNRFNSQYYSFSVPDKSNLLDAINPILIKELESIKWKGILNKYNLQQ